MKANILRSSVIIAVFAGMLSGCVKSADTTTPAPAQTYISFMHLAPTGPSVEVFFNDKKVSSVPFGPGNVTAIYNAVERGAFSIKFKKAASDSLVAQTPLTQYDSLNYYTVYIYNLQANGPVMAIRIKDDFTDVLSNQSKSYYRFFHASPDAGAVDLYIDNVKVESSRMNADNIPPGAFNKFTETNPGAHTLQVKLAGTDTVVTTLNNIDLSAGNAYTLYLKGLNAGTGNNELSLGVLRAAE